MRNRLTSLVLLGAACGLGPAVFAAEKPASYAANGKCFCNLPISSDLDGEIISTPIGGQSLTQVCDRVGSGPELKKTGNSFNYPVYDDVQCGHGPGLTGFSALMRDAGMKEGDVGPKWDLESAYATQALLNQGPSDDVADSGQGANGSTDGALRLKSRYIKPSVSTNVKTAKNATNASSVQKTQDVIAQKGQVSYSDEEQREIASLPLATVEPLKSADTSVADNVSDAKATILNTAEESLTSTQDDEALLSNEAETVAANINQPPATTNSPATAAIRVPAPQTTAGVGSRQFEYLSVLPTGYDFGGAGIQFSASTLRNKRYRIMARAGLASEYQEVLVGAGYLLPVGNSDRLSVGLSGGIEFGRFDLQSGSVNTNSNSSGVFVRASSNFAVSRRFELEGGVGYSSFFEGDPHIFGAALFHVTQKLDFIGEFEAGDNDSAGLGIRYYYR